MRQRYKFFIAGYVVMPEHVHLLIGEPPEEQLSVVLKAIKVSVAKQSRERPFWQPRYYDFNVFTERKRIEKLKYMHRNPVNRGLVDSPEDWPWSSFRHYLTGELAALRSTRNGRLLSQGETDKPTRGLIEKHAPHVARCHCGDNAHVGEERPR